jgi:putative addiction module killer protein
MCLDILSRMSDNIKVRKQLRIYKTKRNKEPFTKWLMSLKDRITRAKIRSRLDRLIVGHYGDYKLLDDGIKELRLHFGAGYRIYFAEQSNIIILLLCGGSKGTQKRDIKKAKKYWLELQARK